MVHIRKAFTKSGPRAINGHWTCEFVHPRGFTSNVPMLNPSRRIPPHEVLPYEILIEILSLSLKGASDFECQYLGEVCQEWCNTLKEIPEYWKSRSSGDMSYVSITLYGSQTHIEWEEEVKRTVELVNNIRRDSRRTPVDLRIQQRNEVCSPSELDLIILRLGELRVILEPLASRLHTVIIKTIAHIVSRHMCDILPLQLPRLHRLFVTRHSRQGQSEDISFNALKLPHLRSLCISGASFKLNHILTMPWDNITMLRVDDHGASLQVILATLRQCPNLLDLRLDPPESASVEEETEILHLPRLHKFTINDTNPNVETLLNFFHFPALKYMHLNETSHAYNISNNTISSFLLPSSAGLLNLRVYYHHDLLGLIPLLNILSSLEKLIIRAGIMNDEFLDFLGNRAHLPKLNRLIIDARNRQAITAEGLRRFFSHRIGSTDNKATEHCTPLKRITIRIATEAAPTGLEQGFREVNGCQIYLRWDTI